MKRLVFELMLIVALCVVSCKYYNSRQTHIAELNRVYQVLVTAKKANDAQKDLIEVQDEAILELLDNNAEISEELDLFKGYREI